MTLEQLMVMGMAEEVAKKVLEAHQNVLKGYVPKATYDEAVTAKTNAERVVKERDKQLEELKKVDAAGLKAEIEKLQGENKTTKEKYDADMKALKTDTALKLALAGKAHDPDIVIGLLDKSKIELDDKGGVKAGLEEQLKSLKESKAFLFADDKQNGPTFRGFKPAEGKDKDNGEKDESVLLAKTLAKGVSDSDTTVQKAHNYYFGGDKK